MSKSVVLMLLSLLTLSGLVMIGSAFAQSIPKPSVPEFTLELVGPPYFKNTTYSLDPNTGQVVAEIGYTNPYSVLRINVENQPFAPFTDSSENTYSFYYNVRFKDHNSVEWVEAYHAWNYYPQQWEGSDYTDVGFSIQGENMGIRVLAGCQVDIQVVAMIGFYGRVSTSPIGGYGFIGEISGWSETQTISIPENIPLNPLPTSPAPIPHEIPEPSEQEAILGVAVTIAVIVAGLGLLLYLIKRK